jgi:DNA invertase Pin-like site-specific DNA recombinase
MSPAEQPPDTGDLPTIAYLRVASSDPGDQTAGTERQRAAIARAAHRLGLTVAEEFIDLGASGMTLDRPALRRLLGHITTRPVGYCIVERLDRLSRDPVQQADLDETLAEAGVVIVDASRDIGEAGR